MMKPPRMHDPCRPIKFVWDCSKDEDGNWAVVVRSHIRIRNDSGAPLSFFVFSPSWKTDVNVGPAPDNEFLRVPLTLADAVYLRLARKIGCVDDDSLHGFAFTRRILFLPTSHSGSSFVRTSLQLGDVSDTTFHFLVQIHCDRGLIDVTILVSSLGTTLLAVVCPVPHTHFFIKACLVRCKFAAMSTRMPTRGT
jgi:hypothetical protein